MRQASPMNSGTQPTYDEGTVFDGSARAITL